MIITQTPLRISLAGGGTDFADYYTKYEGYVVSSTIDKYVYVIVKERFDEKIYVNAARKREIVDNVDDIQHELIRETMKKAGIKDSVEITVLADVPSEGSGLGSSSSLTVGLLNAFYIYQGEQVSTERLAQEACEIEIEICRQPIGKQDQYIAAYGGLRTFIFCKDGKVITEKLLIPEKQKRELSNNLLLFYTQKTRKVTEILAEQRKNIPARLEYLQRIKDLAYKIRDNILNGTLDNIGKILDESWQMKKHLASSISDNEIDEMYEKMKFAGATGGKICGAGGGGFLVVYCPSNKQSILREAMKNFRELPFYLERIGTRVIFNQRGYEWK